MTTISAEKNDMTFSFALLSDPYTIDKIITISCTDGVYKWKAFIDRDKTWDLSYDGMTIVINQNILFQIIKQSIKGEAKDVSIMYPSKQFNTNLYLNIDYNIHAVKAGRRVTIELQQFGDFEIIRKLLEEKKELEKKIVLHKFVMTRNEKNFFENCVLDITKINFKKYPLTEENLNILHCFPNLDCIKLDSQQLTEIPKQVLELKQLRELSLNDNQLVNLNGIEQMIGLESIFLKRNPNLVINLPSLPNKLQIFLC